MNFILFQGILRYVFNFLIFFVVWYFRKIKFQNREMLFELFCCNFFVFLGCEIELYMCYFLLKYIDLMSLWYIIFYFQWKLLQASFEIFIQDKKDFCGMKDNIFFLDGRVIYFLKFSNLSLLLKFCFCGGIIFVLYFL